MLHSQTVLSRPVSPFSNPATRSVTFEWHLPKGNETGHIVISDLQGREVKRISTTGEKGKMEWEAAKLDPGIYYFRIISESNISQPQKIVLIK